MIDGVKEKCDDQGFCTHLQNALVEPLSRGLSVPMMVNVQTGQTSIHKGVMYKKTNARAERGMWINFCPFCATDLRWWEKSGARPLDGMASQEGKAEDTGG